MTKVWSQIGPAVYSNFGPDLSLGNRLQVQPSFRSEPTSKMERRQYWHHIVATDCFIDWHAPFVRVLQRTLQKGCRLMPPLQAGWSAVPLRAVLKLGIVFFSPTWRAGSASLAPEGLHRHSGKSHVERVISLGWERNRLPPAERKTDRNRKQLHRKPCKVFQSCEKQPGYFIHA